MPEVLQAHPKPLTLILKLRAGPLNPATAQTLGGGPDLGRPTSVRQCRTQLGDGAYPDNLYVIKRDRLEFRI